MADLMLIKGADVEINCFFIRVVGFDKIQVKLLLTLFIKLMLLIGITCKIILISRVFHTFTVIFNTDYIQF